MPAAARSSDEFGRLDAVRRVRLLGTPAEERFDRITRLARRMFDVPMACLDLLGEDLAWLKSVEGFDLVEGLRAESYCFHAILEEGLCLVPDARKDRRVHDNPHADSWVFYAGIPLRFDGQRVGVLCIGDDKPRDFSSEDQGALADLGALAEHELQVTALSEAQIALAASNEELEMKTRIDVLTHGWNRGAILGLVAAERVHAAPETPVAVLMIDIDHFKTVNDGLGHVAGDQVLRVFAQRLRAAVRPCDAVGRYGGDEFLAILPSVSIEEAGRIGERIRIAVSSTPIEFEGRSIPVTCSVGCAVATDPGEDAPSLVARADEALYRAKVSGRHRVELATVQIARAA